MRIPTLLTALALAGPASASLDQLTIVQTGPTEFTVAYKGGAMLHNYWCAAGRYVTNTLGLPERTRIYRASPEPRKAGQGISFSLDPGRSVGVTGYTTFGGQQDGSFSAGGAQSDFCNVRRPSSA